MAFYSRCYNHTPDRSNVSLSRLIEMTPCSPDQRLLRLPRRALAKETSLPQQNRADPRLPPARRPHSAPSSKTQPQHLQASLLKMALVSLRAAVDTHGPKLCALLNTILAVPQSE